MTQGYHALTDKEKQTLRLLLAGHDAKSMARHLGLSVHTINERLRDARRKLSASSSREAARLLRDTEHAHPDLVGDNQIGDALASSGAQFSTPSATGSTARRRATWALGGLAMIAVLWGILALSDPAAPPPAATVPAPTAPSVNETEAARAAREWLELGDRSDWAASYAATAASFRAVNTIENWEKASLSVRVPLGRVVKRELIAEVDAPTPPGGNMVVKFRTDFANKPGAVETVALVREGDAWRVVGIYLT